VDGGNPAPLLEHNFETSRTLFNIGGGVAPQKKGYQWLESCTTTEFVNIEKGVRGLLRPSDKNLDMNEAVQDFRHQPTNVIFLC